LEEARIVQVNSWKESQKEKIKWEDLKKDRGGENTDKNKKDKILKTNIKGFDELFAEGGLPRGNSVLVAGGPGTGKSIFCRQVCYNLVSNGKNCVYISFEENNKRIIKSMNSFGWDIKQYIEQGKFIIQNINSLDILRMKFGSIGGSGSAAELTQKIKPLIIPKEFHPEVLVIDSLTAITAVSFTKDRNYRIYLQQLFSFFEETGATSFLITETDLIPTHYSETGIEEFLADGIIVFYNIKKENTRKKAIEVLKMRYCQHETKEFLMEITEKGIQVNSNKTVSIN